MPLDMIYIMSLIERRLPKPHTTVLSRSPAPRHLYFIPTDRTTSHSAKPPKNDDQVAGYAALRKNFLLVYKPYAARRNFFRVLHFGELCISRGTLQAYKGEAYFSATSGTATC